MSRQSDVELNMLTSSDTRKMLNFGSKCSSEFTKNLRRFTRAIDVRIACRIIPF